ncbi:MULTISPECIES: (2Fe-2S) ferredoxin domain-containing protein [Zoogloea]|jgi:(2Fe-2S) ferredoxin|uniref:(2Fe-2S) ferredoxin domain-containing protein n=1 Tax=Zoogloea oleivorans TaxID=1552750 RepID=A0A6C2CDV1_9RHOO|nr:MULTISPECIES: (2Fe-2S) ferredoxin domain-containing protein [Zoogloea]MBP8134022.1 (2Fe-2S) ferredoxin domain-containing protein [Zoogloea sp.]MBT9496896.1 (2Fe-2S) ferredoxin domain-containing protein [Zoogloea sp.]MDD2668450.1 (2Fe-2S) ferredoxin domain-containing protein [Zoogloea sp.]MDY0037070.1 (2Fe-2S) ferredoxin domain-containing protein [Zoogloea oleivorans]TYC51772.1 (2Fe-2S) ferredoxin domain-containing protein [Zoogloea oleivorans]
MSKPKKHVFICAQQRPPGHPRGSCAAKGCNDVLQTFWAELQKRNAYEHIGVTYSGCLGPCDSGPNVLVYPEGVMYSGVGKDDVVEIFDKHLEGDEIVTRLQAPASVW